MLNHWSHHLLVVWKNAGLRHLLNYLDLWAGNVVHFFYTVHVCGSVTSVETKSGTLKAAVELRAASWFLVFGAIYISCPISRRAGWYCNHLLIFVYTCHTHKFLTGLEIVVLAVNWTFSKKILYCWSHPQMIRELWVPARNSKLHLCLPLLSDCYIELSHYDEGPFLSTSYIKLVSTKEVWEE